MAAVERLAVLDRDVISTLAPTGSRLGDALNAVAAAALTAQARFAPHACPPARQLTIGTLPGRARPRLGATMTTKPATATACVRRRGDDRATTTTNTARIRPVLVVIVKDARRRHPQRRPTRRRRDDIALLAARLPRVAGAADDGVIIQGCRVRCGRRAWMGKPRGST